MRAGPQRRRSRTLNPPLGPVRCPPGTVARAAGAVAHPRLATCPVAVGPPLRSGRADLETFGGTAQAPAVLDHATGKPETAGLGQGCITVEHEGLSVAGADVAIHTRPEGPHPFQDHTSVIAVTRPQPPWTEHLGHIYSRGRHRTTPLSAVRPTAENCGVPARPQRPRPRLRRQRRPGQARARSRVRGSASGSTDVRQAVTLTRF